jgi:Zn-dependent peptidase ImmA (M78 family)/DNA-binding XRE family transcriptional regulator
MSHSVSALATPTLIEWARRKAGLSHDQVAKKLQVTPERVSAWESGTLKPTVTQLRNFGRIVKRPLAFFYLPEPPHDFDAIRDFRRLAGVEPEPESPELLLAIRTAHDRRSIALELIEELGEVAETKIPTINPSDDPENIALIIRDNLGYNSSTPTGWSSAYDALNFWRDAIEEKNILVLQFGDVSRAEARGFSLTDLPLPIIAVNRSELPQARIFSLIHELIHLALNKGGLCDFIERENNQYEEQRIEVFCNRVAGAVLVPLADLLSDNNLVGHRRGQPLEDIKISNLARVFRVSREVILRRLLISNQITQQFYEKKRSQYENEKHISQPGFAPPHALALSSAGPTFTNLVLRSYREHRITATDVAEFLSVRLKHLSLLESSLNRRTLA